MDKKEEESTEDLSIANIVGSGKLYLEIDLSAVVAEPDIIDNQWIDDVEHSRRKGNRLLFDLVDNDSLGILAPSGVHVVTGADSFEELEDGRQRLYNALEYIGLLSSSDPDELDFADEFEVQNLVCVADLNREINLNAVSIGLGLENVEYEPEQFPGLVYRPPNRKGTVLIFATGKVVITGETDVDDATETFEIVAEEISEFLK